MTIPLVARILARKRRIQSSWRVLVSRACGAIIGEGCSIGSGCDLVLGFAPPRRGAIVLGDGCDLASTVVLHPYGGEIRLGANVHLGPGTIIYGHGGVAIGDDCLVAMHCRILSAEHDIPPLGTSVRSRDDLKKPTRLGRDVWLGAGVTVLGGVTIGDGCIVGAGAVVTRDLPPGSVCHGTPAVVRGWRNGASPV